MNKYKIYCTESQTKKALGLGAPIERGHEGSRYFNIGVPTFYDENDEVCRVKNSIIFISTAEEMIGWLEEQGITEILITRNVYDWIYVIIRKEKVIDGDNSYPTRKEATLAAIDAALEYIGNLKQ